MSITLSFKSIDGSNHHVGIEPAQPLFLLGANGAGKSSLISKWSKEDTDRELVAGNREVVFSSSLVELSPAQISEGKDFLATHKRVRSIRNKRGNHNNENWLKTLVGDLKSYGEFCKDQYIKADKASDAATKLLWDRKNPLTQINQAMGACGLSLKFSWTKESALFVEKEGVATSFGIDAMSDGERAAFILIAVTVLVDEGQMILIDEPERHLHRSISSPLLLHLFAARQDLHWCIATHDLSLPRDFDDAKFIVLYEFKSDAWKYDQIEALTELSPSVRDAILGAREQVLFIEGDENKSLDYPLYQILFKNVTIHTKNSCNQVVKAVEALNGLGGLTHMTARGLVDADNRSDTEALRVSGIAMLNVYSVESLYFHPKVIELVAERLKIEMDVQKLQADACEQISDGDISKFANVAAEHAFRADLKARPPKLRNLLDANGSHQFDMAPFLKLEENLRQELISAKNSRDWMTLITKCKIRSTAAPKYIRDELGLTEVGYKSLALSVIEESEDVRRELFELVPNPFG